MHLIYEMSGVCLLYRNGMVQGTLNTGAVVNVPQFVKVGQRVRVNTEDGNYIDRA